MTQGVSQWGTSRDGSLLNLNSLLTHDTTRPSVSGGFTSCLNASAREVSELAGKMWWSCSSSDWVRYQIPLARSFRGVRAVAGLLPREEARDLASQGFRQVPALPTAVRGSSLPPALPSPSGLSVVEALVAELDTRQQRLFRSLPPRKRLLA